MKQISFILIIVTIIFVILFNLNQKKDTPKVSTVAFVSLSDVDNDTFSGFKDQMKEYGWIENKNIRYIVPGAAKKVKNLKSIVASVIDKEPDLILVSSTPATQEVKKATKNRNIPVVFCPVNDPVGSKIVLNPKTPEGNITGIRLPIGDSKRFEWLYLIAPSTKNVMVPYTPGDGSSFASRNNIKDVAKLLQINIIEKAFTEDMTIDDFSMQFPKNIDAIFLPRDSRMGAKIKDFVKFAYKHKLPLSAPSYQQVQKGALFTYGFIHTELGKDAARMVDRILKGVNTADLPVKFGNAYLIINEKTAKNIGIIFTEDTIRNARLIIK